MQAEDFAHDGTDEELVVRRLHGAVILPVDFDLFADVRHAPVLVDLRLEAADLLVSHLHVETVFVQLNEAFLKRRPHRTVRALPILFVHHLRGGHLLDGGVVLKRRLDPEFELRCGGEADVNNIRALEARRAGDLRICTEEIEQFTFHIRECVHECRARIDTFSLVDDEGGDAQCADRVRAFPIVVDEPVDRGIDGEIHLRVVDRRDLRQNNGGTICLHGSSVIEFLNVLNENPHGNLLVRIVARHVDADKRDEAHLRMRLKLTNDLFTRRIGRNLIEKFIHLCVPPFSKRMPCGINSRAHLTIFRRSL